MSVFIVASGFVLGLFAVNVFVEITSPKPRVENIMVSLAVILLILLAWQSMF